MPGVTSNLSLPTVISGLVCGLELFILFPFLLPLPHSIRNYLIKSLLTSKLVAKALYGLKITLLFIAVLFADAATTAYKLSFFSRKRNLTEVDATAAIVSSDDYSGRKLLAERNLALTTTALFLAMILFAVFELNVKVAKLELELAGEDPAQLDAAKKISKENFRKVEDAQKPKPDNEKAAEL